MYNSTNHMAKTQAGALGAYRALGGQSAPFTKGH
jgi:hypothetical protein